MDSGALEMRVPKELKKQLALAVRSIHWSYGIFWSISATQPGALEWGDGYYNGDIMTRKTVQGMELNADNVALQRSEQLRQLYESLSVGESSGQTKRPSTALSPEDLTDTEWYYLVCMSFVFEIGQGMPGKTLATGRPIWLCDASYDDTKVFTRTLLAKSASIQTVVCFPFRGGVIELGATDSVMEDLSLIHHVKSSFLEIPYPNCKGDLAISGTSPTTSSNCFMPKQPVEESVMIDAVEDFSDCVSQTFVQQHDEHDLHYEGVLSQLLKCSDPLKFSRHCQKGKSGSSFEKWKKAGLARFEKPSFGTHQAVLKRILFTVPRLHDKVTGGGGVAVGTRHVYRSEADEIGTTQINEQFGILKSMVPYNVVPKTDKESLLDDTIEYLKNLERKVEELQESCSDERTSDNYGDKFRNRTSMNKRKAKEIEQDIDVSDGLVVRVEEKEVMIEMRCGWREGVLLEIVTAVGNLQLDSHSVQTSAADGILSLAIKSKFSGSSVPSAVVIKRALQRFVHQ